ncbi:ferredoxin--NADP reductase [Vibrio zhugei]|uniref:ferredoxin--NADP(+) reductase n=1 Tax=Vibrio zhugei TaxID=2479546 RepID=A0ABV7CE07_9VIBR|nr:ferredoxin--NADP reductase [Vibrio zhugei]
MNNEIATLTSARVTNRQDWNESLFSLTVHSPGTKYKAGQFTKLGMFDDKGELIRRAYSIINHPDEHEKTGDLEFLIVTDPEGSLSPLLHSLRTGDDVLIGLEGAGFMTLDEIPLDARDLWLVSSGTAIGPFLAMLNDRKIGYRFNHLVLVHAVRHASDLVYQKEINQLLQQYPGKFKYVPIVSREQTSGALSGRIPQLLKSGELENTACLQLNKKESFIYLCGNPEMVKDTSNSLKLMGLQKHLRKKTGQFSSENYW